MISNDNSLHGIAVLPPRKRPIPIDRGKLYGDFAHLMLPGERIRDVIRDRAAFLHITGFMPTHLHAQAVNILNQISRPYQRPASIRGHCGNRKLHDEAIRDLKLKQHAMVRAAREQPAKGFFVHGHKEFGERRTFKKVLMRTGDHPTESIRQFTVTLEDAIKSGWD
ncbi:MAG: hypothetical protein JXR15_13420 [Shimia sp.]|uniref:hypothetical protein n=1 Tax=Shimia sp. TaxID=1954381 RepID=UPI003B8B0ADD